MDVGQILESSFLWESKFGTLCFATVVEDADSVNFDEGFTVQECDTVCPSCNKEITIRTIAVSVFTGERVLCLYCDECHLLFRTAAVGYQTWDGEYKAKEGFE